MPRKRARQGADTAVLDYRYDSALKGVIDAERFTTLSGTVSLPFPAGSYRRATVKVIDPRGHEVMRVNHLGKAQYGVER